MSEKVCKLAISKSCYNIAKDCKFLGKLMICKRCYEIMRTREKRAPEEPKPERVCVSGISPSCFNINKTTRFANGNMCKNCYAMKRRDEKRAERIRNEVPVLTPEQQQMQEVYKNLMERYNSGDIICNTHIPLAMKEVYPNFYYNLKQILYTQKPIEPTPRAII